MRLSKGVESIIKLDLERCIRSLNEAMTIMGRKQSEMQDLALDITILEKYRDELREILKNDGEEKD